ncbi:hypothetical protein [Cylindrospermopsis raciborskii]|nr:hypothetical protein [Cylindrospermopsis raciborskii]
MGRTEKPVDGRSRMAVIPVRSHWGWWVLWVQARSPVKNPRDKD